MNERRGRTTVHADGGYYHGLGQGGAAWYVSRTRFRGMSINCPSAELAELYAIVLAVEENEGALVVRTDCQTHARGPVEELVKWLRTRRFAQNPYGEELVDRLEAASEGREVNVTRAQSKGRDAEEGAVFCDQLERYTRQCARLRGAPQQIRAGDLVLPPLGDLREELTHALETLPVPGSEAADAVKALA